MSSRLNFYVVQCSLQKQLNKSLIDENICREILTTIPIVAAETDTPKRKVQTIEVMNLQVLLFTRPVYPTHFIRVKGAKMLRNLTLKPEIRCRANLAS